MITIAPEGRQHAASIESLLDTAFGADRRKKQSYRFRHGVPRVRDLCLVALDGSGKLVGTIRYWPLTIGESPALLLGPIAIAAEHQGTGLGSRLMRESLARAAALGHERVMLVGDIGYYSRFGFGPATELGIAMPGEQPHRLLALGLTGSAFKGVSGDLLPWRSVRLRKLSRAA